MQVNFSRHALQRMDERGVTPTEVRQAIETPSKKVAKGDKRAAIALRHNRHLLIVIYTSSDTIINVITVIVTSKVHKYL